MLERVKYLWLAFAEGVASAASPPNLNFFRRPWNFGDETSRNVNSGGEATSHFLPKSKSPQTFLLMAYPQRAKNVPPGVVRGGAEMQVRCFADQYTRLSASCRRLMTYDERRDR